MAQLPKVDLGPNSMDTSEQCAAGSTDAGDAQTCEAEKMETQGALAERQVLCLLQVYSLLMQSRILDLAAATSYD